MIRRWSIPLVTVVLAFGVMGLAGTASASTSHSNATHVSPGIAALRGINIGGPLRSHGLLSSGEHGIHGTEVESENWSGYAVTGADGAYTSVSSSWTQPTATCSSGRHGRGGSDTYAAFWVGLDGYSSDSVEQTGTLIECVGSTAYYYGWYEMYPSALVTYSNTVEPGDSFTASVTFSSPDQYTLTLEDATRGWTQTQVIDESGLDRSSAEVITEAPCCTNSGGILPLADFGTVTYNGSEANGASLSSESPTEIIIVSASGQQEDSTSSFSSSGSFSNTWITS
ncbi:MAG TPA: G1 family glutamic endopeptidase [Streptosporangiaceae bacterium]|nr:G1 family glutamic endopeptidase [Streptosporangiaceae bacterium]